MKTITLYVLLVLLSGFTSWAVAQEPGPTHPSPPMQELAKEERLVIDNYVGSPSLPDGIAFSATIGMVGSPDPEHRRMSVSLVKKGMHLDSDAEAEALVDRFIDAKKELRIATEEATAANSCEGGTPKAYGDAAYDLLNAMDDIELIVSERIYDDLRKELGQDMGKKLRKWIDEEKLGISAVRFDKRKMHVRAGRIGDETLAKLCNDLEHNKKVRQNNLNKGAY